MFIPGMLTGLALIVAIGAQNAFVLRQGVRREHVGLVVAVCMLSDAVLIFGGTAGVGAVVGAAPWLLEVLRWGGALYLLWFAVTSFRSALQPTALTLEQAPRSAGSVLGTTLALTWLNPHVYLDTVIMLGNLANQQGDQRWVFSAGAITGSVIWFIALGTGAKALSRVLNTPLTWRIVDVFVGVVMLAIALTLALNPAV